MLKTRTMNYLLFEATRKLLKFDFEKNFTQSLIRIKILPVIYSAICRLYFNEWHLLKNSKSV